MRISHSLALLTTVGCGAISGEWEGECAVQVGNDLYIYEVELEIESVEKGDINGTGTLYDQDNNRSIGTLDGNQDGSDVDLDIEFDDGDGAILGQGAFGIVRKAMFHGQVSSFVA